MQIASAFSDPAGSQNVSGFTILGAFPGDRIAIVWSETGVRFAGKRSGSPEIQHKSAAQKHPVYGTLVACADRDPVRERLRRARVYRVE